MLLTLILLPLLFALVCHFVGKRSERTGEWIALSGGVLTFALSIWMLTLPDHTLTLSGRPLFGLVFALRLDGFRRTYLTVIAFLWMMTLLFSGEYLAHYPSRRRYYTFNLATLGLMMGEFMSQSLAQAYVFLVLMTAACSVWMRHERTPDANRSTDSFVRTACIGCGAGLVGLILLYVLLGTTELSALRAAAAGYTNRGLLYAAGGCLLLCFGARAGMVPMHSWLTNTHPLPAPGSALVSGVITKSGIWGVLALSCYLFPGDFAWGVTVLVLGAITMLTGAVLALLSVNLKRTLACSSVSQIGFILVGVGMMDMLGQSTDAALAANGVLLHMVNHSLFKLVLYTCAGVVVMNLHKLELNEIRGFGRNKPLLMLAFLLGALGIAGVPGFSGYISKTLLHESIVEGTVHFGGWLTAVEWLFLLSGGMTLAYMTKLFVALFVEKHPTQQAEFDEKKPYLRPLSALVLLLPALLIPVLGCTAPWTMDQIAGIGTDFFHTDAAGLSAQYFTWENLRGAVVSVAIGAALYVLVVRGLLRKNGRYKDR